MKSRRTVSPKWIVTGMALLLAAAPALARTSFDFLFSTASVTNDHQLFLNLAVSNSGYGRAALEPVLPRVRDVDDLPVILFVAEQCGRPPEYIVDLRSRGLSWSVIFSQLRVSPDALFVGIDRDPGPPYGRAWGYWRRDRSISRLSDGDVRQLVEVQVGSRSAGAPPYELAQAHRRGQSIPTYVAEKHGRPYGKEKSRGSAGHGRGEHIHGQEKD